MTKEEYKNYWRNIDEYTYALYSDEIEEELTKIIEADGESPWDDETFQDSLKTI